MSLFCRQMAQTYDAGIPVLNGLKLASEQRQDKKLRQVVNRMRDSIRAGATLSQAVEAERKYWPNLFIELVGAGEIGGRLKTMFYELARYYDQRLEMRRKIAGALWYPAIQLTVLWFAGSLIFAIRLMQAATDYQFDVNMLLEKYSTLQMWGALVVALVLATAIVLARLGIWKWIWGALKTFVWPFRRFGRTFAVARFAHALGLLLGSGIDVKTATARAAGTADNPYITASLMKALPQLERGATLTQALSPCPYLDSRVREMLYVGEESGTLPESLAKAAEQLELDAMAAAHVAIRIGGVAVLLLVGLIIGWFVISFYINLYSGIFEQLGV